MKLFQTRGMLVCYIDILIANRHGGEMGQTQTMTDPPNTMLRDFLLLGIVNIVIVVTLCLILIKTRTMYNAMNR